MGFITISIKKKLSQIFFHFFFLATSPSPKEGWAQFLTWTGLLLPPGSSGQDELAGGGAAVVVLLPFEEATLVLGAWRAALDELSGRALHVQRLAAALAATLAAALAALALVDPLVGAGQHGPLLGQTGELLQGPGEASAAADRRKRSSFTWCIYTYMYVHTHICMYRHMHASACIHTCIHTYIHTYTHRHVL